MPSEEQEQMVAAPAPKPLGIIVSTPEATAVEGGPVTGKTEVLVQRISSLLSGGADPSQIIVFTATPDAARAFKSRLVAANQTGASVSVTTPRQWHLTCLDTPEAQAYTGRDARLLTPFEYDFLLEDMKVSGMRTKRLREMMKFFFKSVTEMADDAAGDWLISQEEVSAFDMLKNCLGFSRGIIEPELANLTARFLQANPMAKAKMQIPHVFVDDYQMLSRASQMVVNLIARDSITIATDPAAAVEVFESYPYAEGLGEFIEANPNAEHMKLTKSYSCAAAGKAVNLIRADMAIAAEPVDIAECGGNTELIELAQLDPTAEIEAVSAYIAQLLEEGMNPADITVASPHRVWSANLARALQARNIQAERSYSARIVSGDIRTEEKCPVARVLTALYLVANRFDGVAWRSWCGFGDWLTNSNIINNLRTFGGQRGMAIDATLEAAEAHMDVFDNAESITGTQRVIDAYNKGLALVDQAQGFTGRPLLEYLARSVLGEGAEVPAEILQLTAPLADGRFEGDDAVALARRARARLDAPCFENNDCIHITTYERLAGLSPRVVIFIGFVNGFFPIRDYFDRAAMTLDSAARQHERDARLMAAMAGKPTEALVVSHFAEAQLEAAERLRLKLHRIKMKDKKRVALTEPSEYLRRFKA